MSLLCTSSLEKYRVPVTLHDNRQCESRKTYWHLHRSACRNTWIYVHSPNDSLDWLTFPMPKAGGFAELTLQYTETNEQILKSSSKSDFSLRNTKLISFALFWVTTRRVVVTSYRRFGTCPQGRFLTLKKGPIGCPETSVRNYHYSLCNNLEERSSQLLRGGSLKSLISFITSSSTGFAKVFICCWTNEADPIA